MSERITIPCTRQQLSNLIAALDAKIERLIAEGWTVSQVKEEYNTMLSRQLNDWQKQKEYFDSLEKKDTLGQK